jgi:hypothetical protein
MQSEEVVHADLEHAKNSKICAARTVKILFRGAERPAKRLCAARLTCGREIDCFHTENSIFFEDVSRGKFRETTEDKSTNAADAGLAFEMNTTNQILGGVLSSRFTLPDISLPVSLSAYRNRLHLKDERAQMFPSFAGCPAWAKPLLFQEYQVQITV